VTENLDYLLILVCVKYGNIYDILKLAVLESSGDFRYTDISLVL